MLFKKQMIIKRCFLKIFYFLFLRIENKKLFFVIKHGFFFSIKYKTVLENSYQTSPKSFVFHVFILRKALQKDG